MLFTSDPSSRLDEKTTSKLVRQRNVTNAPGNHTASEIEYYKIPDGICISFFEHLVFQLPVNFC